MFSRSIQNLIERFRMFPGVGPKQAARFVFYLLREDRSAARALAEAVANLHDEVKICRQCYKAFDGSAGLPQTADGGHCEICRDRARNPRQVLIVEKEADLESIERTRKYEGLYHVLGGTIDPLDSAAPARLHVRELFERAKKLAESGAEAELILATNPTAEGDATALYLTRLFEPLRHQYPAITVARLGRGLSTGSELEYADEITIANALQNRK